MWSATADVKGYIHYEKARSMGVKVRKVGWATWKFSGIILDMKSANERLRYKVTKGTKIQILLNPMNRL